MKGWLKFILISMGVFFIVLSLIFFLAGLSPDIEVNILIEAVILLIFGAVPIGLVIYFEKKESSRPMNVTQNINIKAQDLVGGSRKTSDIKCSGCSAPLSSSDLAITDLGVMVKCPYCGKAYVLEEAPKW